MMTILTAFMTVFCLGFDKHAAGNTASHIWDGPCGKALKTISRNELIARSPSRKTHSGRYDFPPVQMGPSEVIARSESIDKTLKHLLASLIDPYVPPLPREIARSNPWLITVRVVDDHYFQLYGHAALIRARQYQDASDIAITSARVCKRFKMGEKYIAEFGSDDLMEVGTFYVTIVGCYSHPDYVPNVRNDIAVIKFNTPVNFTEERRPICMPDPEDPLPVGRHGHIAGLGNPGNSTNSLREVGLEVIAPTKCPRQSASIICVGGHGNESKGYFWKNRGGPFVEDIKQKHTAIGIATGEGDSIYMDFPIIFTRISYYIRTGWIEDTMKTVSALWRQGQSNSGQSGKPGPSRPTPPTRPIPAAHSSQTSEDHHQPSRNKT